MWNERCPTLPFGGASEQGLGLREGDFCEIHTSLIIIVSSCLTLVQRRKDKTMRDINRCVY